MYLCCHGQKRSSVARIAKVLNDKDCMKFTILLQLLLQIQLLTIYSSIFWMFYGRIFYASGLSVLVFMMI
jgi:F0F1-type ATP synthase alpha subunit